MAFALACAAAIDKQSLIDTGKLYKTMIEQHDVRDVCMGIYRVRLQEVGQ